MFLAEFFVILTKTLNDCVKNMSKFELALKISLCYTLVKINYPLEEKYGNGQKIFKTLFY